MGNAQVNSTFTPKNHSNITNGTYGGYTQTTALPPFRPPQSRAEVRAQLEAIACIGTLTFAVNLVMVICTSIRLKAVPYMFIQNFMVIDIVTAVSTSGPWATGVLMDSLGLGKLSTLCRIQGFFHNTLATVFLATVTAIAAGHFLNVVSPKSYAIFFVNKPIVRLLLFAMWFGAGFLASPPLNPGVWGAYANFDGTCWLSWKKGNPAVLSYSSFHTIITLSPAVIFTVLAIVFILPKKKSIHPAPAAPSMQISDQPGLPPPAPTTTGSTREGTLLPNLEVLYVSCALFLLYLMLWTAITIVEAMFSVHWSNVDYKVVIVFTFLYQSRGLLHPFMYVLLSAEIRRAFKCSGKRHAGIALSVDTNLPQTPVANVRAPEERCQSDVTMTT